MADYDMDEEPARPIQPTSTPVGTLVPETPLGARGDLGRNPSIVTVIDWYTIPKTEGSKHDYDPGLYRLSKHVTGVLRHGRLPVEQDEGTRLPDIIGSAERYRLFPYWVGTPGQKQKYLVDALFLGSNKPRFEVKLNTYRGCENWAESNPEIKMLDFLNPNTDRGDLVTCIVECPRNPMTVYAIRMIQGHSNRLTDPQTLGWKRVQPSDTKFLFHMTDMASWASIRDYGLLAGNMVGRGGRAEIFFTAKWRDFGGPQQTLPAYDTWNKVCVIVDAIAAMEDGADFWMTRSNAVVTRSPIDTRHIVYILDNKMGDPMARPLFKRLVWTVKPSSSVVSGGTLTTPTEQPSSGSREAWADWSEWKESTWSGNEKWDKADEAMAQAASSAAPADVPPIPPAAAPSPPAPADKTPDPLDEANRADWEETYRVFLLENPGIEELSIKDRRIWQRYLYRRAPTDVPTRECGYCSNMCALIETACPNCKHSLVPGGTPAASTPNVEDMRLSHQIMLGHKKVDNWKLVNSGMSKGNKESQREKDHYKRARQQGYNSCMHRYMNDPWYRNTCEENGLGLRDMYRFEANGNPAARENIGKPMSKLERQEAGLQRWVPVVDYDEDQGGNDTNYRQRLPKAKSQRVDKDDSGWKWGSWQRGTFAAPKQDNWEKHAWWYD